MELSARDHEIVKHYINFWGQPSTIFNIPHNYKTAPAPVIVMEFAPTTPDQDWVYATLGASRTPLKDANTPKKDKRQRRIELFIYSNERNTELREILTRLAIYPFEHNTFFAPHHTVRGEKSIVEGSPLTDVLFQLPYGEPNEFWIVRHNDSSHTHILWVIPIYRSEKELVNQRGWEALRDLFEQQNTDTSDFRRSPVI